MNTIEVGDFVVHTKQLHLNHGKAFRVIEIFADCVLCKYLDADRVWTMSVFDIADLIPK